MKLGVLLFAAVLMVACTSVTMLGTHNTVSIQKGSEIEDDSVNETSIEQEDEEDETLHN